MGITDELREYTEKQIKWLDMSKVHYRKLFSIADRIDAEHESACAEAYGNGVQSVGLPDMTAYVKLPVDADGELIHVGDMMENIVCPSVHRVATGVGVECFYGWDEGNGRYSQFDANCYRHYHAPTVEDVLREFAAQVTNGGRVHGALNIDSAIAECAPLLRLAGED